MRLHAVELSQLGSHGQQPCAGLGRDVGKALWCSESVNALLQFQERYLGGESGRVRQQEARHRYLSR